MRNLLSITAIMMALAVAGCDEGKLGPQGPPGPPGLQGTRVRLADRVLSVNAATPARRARRAHSVPPDRPVRKVIPQRQPFAF